MDPLKNVIWQALTTRQSEFAEKTGQARRFPREVTSLGALSTHDDQGYKSLADLLPKGEVAALFLEEPYQPRPCLDLIAAAPLLEMVCDNGKAAPSNDGHTFVELGPKDSAEMVELTALTKPGPFGTRTHELGTYLGIRHEGKLVAMAGERLKVPGYTEVSAVCTHPDHTGKGYARVLMLEVMRRIREHGETPMLHVRQDNARAIDLYKRLGYHEHSVVHLAVLRKI
jgi:ribosomal protein S18 acetylase RimI-like enzyme